MRTAGEILKAARLEKGASLIQASKVTKINRHFLEALEKDRYRLLPSPTCTRGFLKNYAEYLELPADSILAVFRRDFGQSESASVKEKILPKTGSPDQPSFRWQPKMTLLAVLLVFFLGMFGYLANQYFSLSQPPRLELQTPRDKQMVSEEKVEVLGQTDPDASVTVNDQPVFLTAEGGFRYKVELFSGENKIVVESLSRLGKKSQFEVTVFHP